MKETNKLTLVSELINDAHRHLCDVVFDEDRGLWGAEVEAALSSAEQDLVVISEQIEFVKKARGIKR